jgi:CRP/FNR family transcriptional regulator, cyclic AMP receptor protein
MDPVAVLGETPLFRGVPLDQLEVLSPTLRVRTFPKATFIFHQGDSGDAMFAVTSGQVKIGRIGRGGDEVVFAIVVPGETFGELALFEQRAVRAADAQATELSQCLTIGREPVLRFFSEHPPLMHRIVQILSGYVRDVDESLSEAAFLDIPGRVAGKLLELAESHGERTPAGVRIRLRLTQTMLAGMVAASRANVNRALSRFLASGAIQQERGYITVVRPSELRSRA